MDSNFLLIEKESLQGSHYPTNDVLKSEVEKKNRKLELDRAIALGNLEHQKVKIYFEDDQKKKMVNTTIWAVTDNEIVLKQHVIIPIHRIHKLEI